MTHTNNIYNIYHIFLIIYLGFVRVSGDMWAQIYCTFTHIRAFIVRFAVHMHYYRQFSLENPVPDFCRQKSLKNLLKNQFYGMLAMISTIRGQVREKHAAPVRKCSQSALMPSAFARAAMTRRDPRGPLLPLPSGLREHFASTFAPPAAFMLARCRHFTGIKARC